MRRATPSWRAWPPSSPRAALRPDIFVAVACFAATLGAVDACSGTPPRAQGDGAAGSTGAAGTTGVGGEAGHGPDTGAAGTGTDTGAAGADAVGVGGSGGSGSGGATGASGANGQMLYCVFDSDFMFTTPAGLTGSINRSGPDFSLLAPSIVCTSWHTFTYCGAPGLDIYDIAKDVQDPDVQQGLSIGLYAAVYGDPTAGNPWKFGRGPNETMTVYKGTDCSSGQCKLIAPGIARLIDDLDQMVTALVARPDCPL